MKKHDIKILHFLTALQDCYKDEDERESAVIESWNFLMRSLQMIFLQSFRHFSFYIKGLPEMIKLTFLDLHIY